MTDSEVIAGTINGSGSITVKVTKTGDNTALSGIMKLVADAQASKSKTQLLADKAASYLFYYALLAAVITAFIWIGFTSQGADYVLERIVAVLVIACPHALGLAIPLVTAISTSKAASVGVLVRKRSSLESARSIDIVLFDKTGTLTKGEQGVVEVIGDNQSELLSIAAALEADSEHPIAKAIVAKAQNKAVDQKKVKEFSAIEGKGATAKVNGTSYYIGGPQLLKQQKVTLPKEFQKVSDQADVAGQSIVYLLQKNQVIGGFIIADVIREESKQAVAALQSFG